MSAFLGPIHYWLYNKITLQESLTADIINYAAKAGWSGDFEQYRNNDSRELGEIIDVENIHGWLQTRILEAEGRYARLLADILRDAPERIEELKHVAYDFGTKNLIQSEANPTDIYQRFEDILLNGMPCDRINQVTEQSPESISWEQVQDIHAQSFADAGLTTESYYTLRYELMRGMTKATKYKVHSSGINRYQIAL